MKKILLALILATVLFACKETKKEDPLQKEAKALEDEVMLGHDVAMPKSMKIPDLEKKVKAMLDSIEKLPAKAKEAASPLTQKLQVLAADLSYAYNAMDKWMVEFEFDSARSNLEQRIKYLTEEKLKVNKMKDAVLNSLSKADSLLKAKL
jgi:prefoldin subunit 5